MIRDDLVKTGPSRIHGTGLFAAAPIPKGTVIGDMEGMPATRDPYHPHTLWMEDEIGIRVQGMLRFINHSRKPNAAYQGDLFVVAIRDIARGEEITHDYGW